MEQSLNDDYPQVCLHGLPQKIIHKVFSHLLFQAMISADLVVMDRLSTHLQHEHYCNVTARTLSSLFDELSLIIQIINKLTIQWNHSLDATLQVAYPILLMNNSHSWNMQRPQ